MEWSYLELAWVLLAMTSIRLKETADAVYNAIKVGYRLFDCAAAYGNEKDIGQFKEVMCRFHYQFTKMSMQEICVQ